MDVLYNLVVVTHMLGLAALVGAYFVVLRGGGAGAQSSSVLVWGARVQVVTGLLLVGISEGTAAGPDELNHAKIGVKLVVSVAVAALAEIATARSRRGEGAPAGLVHGAGALAILNVAVASLWR